MLSSSLSVTLSLWLVNILKKRPEVQVLFFIKNLVFQKLLSNQRICQQLGILNIAIQA
jgi:hypothetical protein